MRVGVQTMVYLLLMIVYLSLVSSAYSQQVKEGRSSTAPECCASSISIESFNHAPPKIAHNKDLTSTVYYNGSGMICRLAKDSSIRIEFPRALRVSDVGVHNSFFFDSLSRASQSSVRLVWDEKSHGSIKYDCPLLGRDANFAYFRCLSSKKVYDQNGIMSSAVELTATNGSLLVSLESHELLKIIRKSYDDHPNFGERCLAPGWYWSQVSQVPAGPGGGYQYGQTVSGRCHKDVFTIREGKRTCSKNGWSGSPSLCSADNGGFTYQQYLSFSPESFIEGNETVMSYNINRTFIHVVSVEVFFECLPNPCNHERLNEGNVPNVDVTLGRALPERDDAWNKTWSNLSITQPYAVHVMSRSQKLPRAALIVCKNCTVNVKSGDSTWLQHWNLTKVTIQGWSRSEFEWYFGLADGCPPIDPYIGMPDKYAGKVSRESNKLNEDLRENPCREGYWHTRTAKYEQNPRQCINNAWTGEIPICILITCRTPPLIENGYWRYRNAELYHEVEYSCDKPVSLDGHGIATCNYTTNAWEQVPSCTISTAPAEPDSTVSSTTDASSTNATFTQTSTDITTIVSKRDTDVIGECPPIDPYIGIPDDYAVASVDNFDTLNKNLRDYPCREGFWLKDTAEYRKSPRQCIGNAWIGEIPQCDMITCKTPPRIENGNWRYRGGGKFHEAVYVCNEPLVPSNGAGIARCNHTTNEWEDVPNCIANSFAWSNTTALPAGNKYLITISIFSLGIVLAVITSVAVFIWFRRRKEHDYVEAAVRETHQPADKVVRIGESLSCVEEPARTARPSPAAKRDYSLDYEEVELGHYGGPPVEVAAVAPLNDGEGPCDHLYEIPKS